jgi:hypothetical protein
VLDINTQLKLFECSAAITDAEWIDLKAVTSPCPTLKVIGAVTKGMVKREELKRMREMGRPGLDEAGKIKVTRRKKIAAVTDKVVSTGLKHTVGRLARFASRRLLGEIPETAKTGSFGDVLVDAASSSSLTKQKMTERDAVDLMNEVSQQLDTTASLGPNGPIVDQSDEALFQEIFDDRVVPPAAATAEKVKQTAA